MNDIVYTISARGKSEQIPMLMFLYRNFQNLNMENVDSVFGFLEFNPLYGGRSFIQRQISDQDVRFLYNQGIGVRIPLTNSYVSREEYIACKPFLTKYHRKGNSIITTIDSLAEWIRLDYPQYNIEASVIKGIDSQEKINTALELYDTVILPMKFCIEYDFLSALVNKEKITLFANAGCAYNCPAKVCYDTISKQNKRDGQSITTPSCSKKFAPRESLGLVDFDIPKLYSLGFKRFKLLRSTLDKQTCF
jgi:hypothetical protein